MPVEMPRKVKALTTPNAKASKDGHVKKSCLEINRKSARNRANVEKELKDNVLKSDYFPAADNRGTKRPLSAEIKTTASKIKCLKVSGNDSGSDIKQTTNLEQHGKSSNRELNSTKSEPKKRKKKKDIGAGEEAVGIVNYCTTDASNEELARKKNKPKSKCQKTNNTADSLEGKETLEIVSGIQQASKKRSLGRNQTPDINHCVKKSKTMCQKTNNITVPEDVKEPPESVLRKKQTSRKRSYGKNQILETVSCEKTIKKKPKTHGLVKTNAKGTDKCASRQAVPVQENASPSIQLKEESDSEDDFEDVQETKHSRKSSLAGKTEVTNAKDIGIVDDGDKEVCCLPQNVQSYAERVGMSLGDSKAFTLPKTVDHNDAMAVLLHMEGTSQAVSQQTTSKEILSDSDDEKSDSDEEWEDVEGT